MYVEGDVPYIANGNCNGNGNGMWGSDGIWAILLLALLGFGRGYGYGGNFGGGQGYGDTMGWQLGRLATTNDVASGFSTSEIMSDLNDIILGQSQGFAGVQQTLCQGFSGVNQAISNSAFNTERGLWNLSSQFADCCCQTQRAIDGVNYNMAMNTNSLQNSMCLNTRDIVDAVNNSYRSLHDEIVANRIEDKNAQIQAQQNEINALRLSASQSAQNTYLIDQLKPCPIPAYITCNPYQSYYPYNNSCCNSGCNCGNY